MEGMQSSSFYSPPAAMMGPAAPVGTPVAQQGFYQAPAMPAGPMAPTNDQELQALLGQYGPKIKSLQGQAQLALGDQLHDAVSVYAKSNPQSTMAQQVLQAAQDHAPEGASFKMKSPGPAAPMRTQLQ